MSEVDTIEHEEDEASAPVRTPGPALTQKKGQDLVIVNQGNAVVPMPKSFAQMIDMASLMAQAGSMVGVAFRDNPGACLGVIVQAMRWGMEPYAVSQKCYVASRTGDGPIAYEGQLVHAVILKNAPLQKRLRCSYEGGDGDDRRIVVTGLLTGEDEPMDYRSPTVSKLRKPAGKGSPLWYDDPDQQLWYYGVRAWARKWCPDVMMGVYTPEEIQEAKAIGGDAAAGGEVFTLTQGAVGAASEGEKPQEAEFTDVSKVIAKNAPAKPAAKTTAKKAAPKDGPKSAGDREESSREDSTKAKPAAPAVDSKPAETDEVPTDAEIIASVEAAEKTAKGQAKGTFIKSERGALERIKATSEDADLAERAGKLLDRYED